MTPIFLLLLSTLALPNLFSDGGGNDGGGDAYKSGLDYGCYDAGITNSSERYINQPGKNASYHTEAFMIGYMNGLRACDIVYDEPVEACAFDNVEGNESRCCPRETYCTAGMHDS